MYEGVQGGQEIGVQNEDGERSLEFADSYDLVVSNTFFKRFSEKSITFKYGRNSSVIDYVVAKKNDDES